MINTLAHLILEKLKYPQMDPYRIQQREHVSNVLVAKYANKSHEVSLIDHFFHTCSIIVTNRINL